MAYERGPGGDTVVRSNPIRVLIWYDTIFQRADNMGDANADDGGLKVYMNSVGFLTQLG